MALEYYTWLYNTYGYISYISMLFLQQDIASDFEVNIPDG